MQYVMQYAMQYVMQYAMHQAMQIFYQAFRAACTSINLYHIMHRPHQIASCSAAHNMCVVHSGFTVANLPALA